MAMNGTQLGNDIADAIMHSDATDEARKAVIDLWQKIGNVIVSHIQNNARVLAGINVATNVTTTVTVATPSGPGTGSGVGNGSGGTTEEGRVR